MYEYLSILSAHIDICINTYIFRGSNILIDYTPDKGRRIDYPK